MSDRTRRNDSRSHRGNGRSRVPNEVRVLGELQPVIDEVRVQGKRYWLLKRLTTIHRERYLGFDSGFGHHGRPVAILFLPRSATSRQHLQALHRVSSDSLPAILDFDVQRDRFIVVLDWVRGPTLAKYLRDMIDGAVKRISPTVAVHRARNLAHGLYHWHRQLQVVHGDIKPSNIVINDLGRLVLIDFGSAWTAERTAFRSAGDGVDPIYAAPELQFGDGCVDLRSDQFSLSVILYQLLTLQIPWGQLGGQAGRPESMARGTLRLTPPCDRLPQDQRLPRSVREGIDRVVVRGLALAPDQRYPTPQAWLNNLDAVHFDIQQKQKLSPFLDRLTGVVASLMKPFQKD